MTPKSIYQQKMADGSIRPDANQSAIIEKLDAIFQALLQQQNKSSWFDKFRQKKSVKGLYLWGSVGIGKTFMMDCFYEALPMPKMRTHFHKFMQQTHEDMRKIQGQKNPLKIIAKKIAAAATVICFDEFLVSNIADAMILSGLLSALFDEGITLITSSNTPPDLLYKDGLQRERFIPAIELIKTNTEVIHLHTHTDYRKQHIQQAGVYYHPQDAQALKQMENCFMHFSRGIKSSSSPITICNRPIPIIKEAGTVVWFQFETICGQPRSQVDYLKIAQQYHTILLSDLRQINEKEDNLITNFIFLVDILYDAHCRLVISATTPIDKIYTNGKAHDAYQRTYSRLMEMQSESYVYPGSISENLTVL